MIKTGTFVVNDELLYIWHYTQDGRERIDIANHPEIYNYALTEQCRASYIVDGSAFIYGDQSLISAYRNCVQDAITLQLPEKQDLKTDDVGLIFIISKEDDNGEIKYE